MSEIKVVYEELLATADRFEATAVRLGELHGLLQARASDVGNAMGDGPAAPAFGDAWSEMAKRLRKTADALAKQAAKLRQAAAAYRATDLTVLQTIPGGRGA